MDVTLPLPLDSWDLIGVFQRLELKEPGDENNQPSARRLLGFCLAVSFIWK